jgi:hypothetical protein
MANEVIPSKYPHIFHLRIYGDLTDEDLSARHSDDFEGEDMYALIDVSGMSFHLPTYFLNKATNVSLLRSPKLRHIAVVSPSITMRRFLNVTCRMLGITNISIFSSVDNAVDAINRMHDVTR